MLRPILDDVAGQTREGLIVGGPRQTVGRVVDLGLPPRPEWPGPRRLRQAAPDAVRRV